MKALNAINAIELFHLLFLEQLRRKLDQRCFALKGGCNFRFFFKSIRYSEDMYLDVWTVSRYQLQDRVRSILNAQSFAKILRTHRLSLERISEPKQTDTTQRWKLGLLVNGIDMPLPTKVEFSRRGMTDDPILEPIDAEIIKTYGLAPFMTSHYPAEAAYLQKIKALVGRTATQSRDVFDLYWLISSGVKTKLPAEMYDCQHQAVQNALSVTFATFKSQVLSYLAPTHYEQYALEAVWDTIVLTVIDALEAGVP